MRAQKVASSMLAAAMFSISSAPSGAEQGDGFVRVTPDQVVWTDVRGYEGVKFATLSGDPSKTGVYVIRVKFSPGRMTMPHWHPEDRHVIVISGTWYMGEGDSFDPEKTVPLKPGSYAKHPAGAHHFDGAKNEEVILQIVGYGPSATTFVHPERGNTGSSFK